MKKEIETINQLFEIGMIDEQEKKSQIKQIRVVYKEMNKIFNGGVCKNDW